MKSARLAALFALAGVPLVMAADAVPRAKMEFKPKEFSVQYEDYAFPSGLRVVFQEDHSQPLVSITAVTDRGSTADPPGKEGIAHVVEHLWFRSKHKTPEGQELPKVWDLLEEMGANLNAFTADDQTVYMTVAPVSNLTNLLRLEGLRMRSAVEGVTNDVLLVEREVVRNELRMRYENASGAVFGHLMVKLFPNTHPYGRSAYAGIGNNASLNAITIEDVQKFVKDHYTPTNTTIFVVGDFDSSKASDLLQEIGTDLMVDPKNPDAPLTLVPPQVRVKGPAAEPPPPVQPAEVRGQMSGVTKVKGAVEGPLVAIGWSVPAGWRDNDALMQIAAQQLTPAIYSELNAGWSYAEDAPISGIGCGLQPQLEGSAVICTIELAKGEDGVKVADTALNGLYKVWSVSEDEISRRFQDYIFNYGRLQSMAYTLQQVDLISSLFSERVTSASMYAHYTGDLQYFSRNIESMTRVNPKEVQDFAQKYLNRQRAVAVVMEPYEDGDVDTSTSDAQYRGARREDAVQSIMPMDMLTPEYIARTVIPPDRKKITETKLANGMRVVVMPYTNGPLVQSTLVFGGGTLGAPNGEAGFANAMQRNDSYRSVDALRLAGFDGYGIEALTTEFQVASSAGNLVDAMYVLRQRIDGIQPDTNGRIDYVKDRKKSVLTWMKEPEAWASREAMRRLFPNHPLSTWLEHDKLDAMNKWGMDVAERVWAGILDPSNATLVIVGNVTQEEAKAAVDTYFAPWQGWRPQVASDFKPVTDYPAPTEPQARSVLVINKDNSSQTNVTYECQVGPLTADNTAAAQVLGKVLSEGAWLALREQTGASYGAYAYVQPFRGGAAGGPGILTMNSLVQNDAAGLAASAMLGLGEDAKAGKLDATLVALSKFSQAQEYVLGQQSTSQMLDRLLGTIRAGRTWDWFDLYPKTLGNVTIDQMKPLMDRCVGKEVVTLVGPAASVSASLDKAGVTYEVFDWKQARLDYATKHGLKDILKAEEKRKKDEAKKAEEKK